MRNEGEKLYLKRKMGEGMGFRYTLRHLSPSLIVFLIVTVLVFVMVFISSMTGAIDRMIVLLGCGSISSPVEIESSLLPEGSKIDIVREGQGILYSEEGKSLVYLKGVEESYFEGERGDGIRLKRREEKGRNSIIISSSLANSLSLELGDRLTLLLYETENNRARPLLMTVDGIYESGYAQLDKYLSYVDFSLVEENEGYEVLLEKNVDISSVVEKLREEGIPAITYKEKYEALSINVEQSVMILYIILVLVALLASFFSTDIAHVYISKDRLDIASLRMLGMKEKIIRRIYFSMTLSSVFISTILAVFCGILLSFVSPSLISFVSRKRPELVEYYISSFSIDIPYFSLLIMIILMLLCSSITLMIELHRTRKKALGNELLQQR